ncbi:hypothetical protein [Mucilaginibacter sp. AK015]|uniref:hypothetical protein n=1 Tax=Mucilaginibacter sp. AK015 TaxID=2723072 RepID=UPI00160F39F0|nr:hypothetical protein [Mucilaginibacter sp. AK015]MBB5395054.1 hypothetical protein [Mucilaginibacter sp. AK015]
MRYKIYGIAAAVIGKFFILIVNRFRKHGAMRAKNFNFDGSVMILIISLMLPLFRILQFGYKLFFKSCQPSSAAGS